MCTTCMKSKEERKPVTVRYRLYPNHTELGKLRKTLETCCELYNLLLDDELAFYIENGRKRSKYELNRRMTEISNAHPHIMDGAYSTNRQDVTDRVFKAMEGCRPGKTGALIHVPRHRSINRYDSFRFPSKQGFGFKGTKMQPSPIGDITYRNDHHPKGDMRVCTVKRDARGKWYAFIMYWRDIRGEFSFDNMSAIGYDLGLKDLITDSLGNKIEVPDFYERSKPEIAKAQAKMQRNEKGSPGWDKWRRKLAMIHQDIHRKRRGFLDKLAHDIVHESTIVVFEDLNVKKMKERQDNGPAVRDRYTEASWGMLVEKVRFKAEEAGAELILVDPRNTSRTCSGCGNVKSELPLSVRTYSCECCGLTMDRDRNAAINILHRGLNTQSLRSAVNGRPC